MELPEIFADPESNQPKDDEDDVNQEPKEEIIDEVLETPTNYTTNSGTFSRSTKTIGKGFLYCCGGVFFLNLVVILCLVFCCSFFSVIVFMGLIYNFFGPHFIPSHGNDGSSGNEGCTPTQVVKVFGCVDLAVLEKDYMFFNYLVSNVTYLDCSDMNRIVNGYSDTDEYYFTMTKLNHCHIVHKGTYEAHEIKFWEDMIFGEVSMHHCDQKCSWNGSPTHGDVKCGDITGKYHSLFLHNVLNC